MNLILRTLKFSANTKAVHKYYINNSLEFLFQFFISADEKIRSITDKEDWNQFTSIPKCYQSLLNLISDTNIFESKTNEDSLPLPTFNMTLSRQSDTIDSDYTNALIIIGSTYKSTYSILEIFSFLFDIVKLINYLDTSLLETIIYQLVKIIKHYLSYCKETIIDGVGVKKGKMKSISQKHIILLNSNSILLSFMIEKISKNISETFSTKSEIILPSFKELLNAINKINLDCKEKIYDLFYQTIEDSLNELSKISFPKYPVLNKSEYNQYCIKFSMFKTLYNHMIHGFSNQDIIEVFKNNFTIYFDKLEKSILASFNNSKIESDAGFKQLKSDLLFFKKFLKQFEIIDTEVYKNKVDVIMKAVLPAKLLKGKKNSNKNAVNEDNK